MSVSNQFVQIDRKSRKKFGLSLGEMIFWIAFSLLVVIHCIENTSLIYLDVAWINGMYLLRNLLYLVLLAKAAFLSVYRPKELWGMLGVLLAGVLCFVCSDDFTLMEFAIIVIAAKDISPRKLVAVFAAIKMVAVILTLVLASLEILPTLLYENGAQDPYDTHGFCHRNVLGANMVVLCLCWFYLRYKNLRLWDVILWCVLSLVTYFLAASRSSLIIMLASIALIYAFRIWEPRIMKIPSMRYAFPSFFLLLLLISLVCTIFYQRESDFWTLIDGFFTKRLRFANQCYQEYGFSLFGQNMPFVSTLEAQETDAARLILDNAYMRALLYDGIVPGGLFLLAYWKALDLSYHKKKGYLIVMLLIMAIYGMSERFMLDAYYNFPLVVACLSFFRRPTGNTAGDYRLPFEYAWEVLQHIWQWCRKRFRSVPEGVK